MEIKWIGAALIFLSSAYAGMRAAWTVRRMSGNLRALSRALETMRSEIGYGRTPFARLCDVVAQQSGGELGSFFQALANAAEQPDFDPVQKSRALSAEHALRLPKGALEALLELLGSFGRYDLQGQLALIALTQTRIRDEQLWLDQDRRNRCRLYETLGVCTGLALMILVI